MGGAVFVQDGGSLTLAGPVTVNGNSVTGGAGGAGSHVGTAGSAFGSGFFLQGNGTLAFSPAGGETQTLSDGIADQTGSGGTGANAGSWALTKTGAGTTILMADNTYTGATTVNAGALLVNGSIASSSGLTVAPGALVGGTGFLPTTTINGTLSPGNSIGTITVNGNLAFGAGGQYVVEVSPTAADRTNVTGTATLAGNVLAIFASGSYITKQYTILHADDGLGGTTFGGVASSNPNFNAGLSYGANDVILSLTAALGNSVNGLNQNQVNVATAINGFFNNGGALPPNFLPLFGLTGTNLATALSQLSGEAPTAAQYGAFQLGNQFFSLMLDPLVYGRGPALGFAPTGVGPMRLAAEETQAPEIALAYAKILKEPPAPPALFLGERRWNVWAGGYGGTNRTQGDPVVVGSHDVTARTGGYGAGIDYRIWPGTTVGVALAGGLTNWGLASGLGGGNSDAFQAGLYGITRNGPAYLAGALAFAEHWMSTDRFAFAGDHLTASFNAQSYGGRIEGGWRFATFVVGVAPYAAVQAQAFHTPAYNELDGTLGGFGLNYNARNGSDTRSELGARFDQALPVATTAVLALNARAAWAHDWVTNPSLTPVFQALPGASFIVNGATPVSDSALLSAGGELRFLNGWAIGGRFDGEFADRAQTYAGTATLRYVW
jgi:autotransporter-associated beta strand protein